MEDDTKEMEEMDDMEEMEQIDDTEKTDDTKKIGEDEEAFDKMIDELDIFQDIEVFQRDVVLDRLSSIILEQGRRNVIYMDASVAANVIDETLKQTANLFIQNLDKFSKMDIISEKIDVELDDMDKLIFETSSKILKDEKFVKKIQRADTEHREPSMDTLCSKIEASEIAEMQRMQIEVPMIDSFTPLEAAAISSVLEEFLQQLATIGFMIAANVDPRWDDTFKTIDEEYGVPDEPRRIFREDTGLLPLVPLMAEKMQRDRYYVYKVIEKILRDVRENRRFDSLQKEIDNIAKRQEGEHNLEANAQKWLHQAEQFRELLKSDKKAKEEHRKKTIKLAQESDAQVDCTIFLNSGKLGFAERWAKTRLEQQELKLELQKTDMLNSLSDYSKEYSVEQIVSGEAHTYLEVDIKEKEKLIEEWTKRYNEELVQREQEIEELKILTKKQKSEIEKMQALIDERQEFIDTCIAEEERLQEEARYQERINKAATVIQSVWRGYAVRSKLRKEQERKVKKPKKEARKKQ